MAEELGRIQRPTASQYDGRRKLLLVPLIYGPQADDLACVGVEFYGSLRLRMICNKYVAIRKKFWIVGFIQ